VTCFWQPSNNIWTVLAKANHQFMIGDRLINATGVASTEPTVPGLQGSVSGFSQLSLLAQTIAIEQRLSYWDYQRHYNPTGMYLLLYGQ
jgi:hypothetical protein